MRVIRFTQVHNELKSVIDRVIADCDGENAALLSEPTSSSMLETLHLVQSPANVHRLAEALAQDRTGAAQAQKLMQE